MAFDVTGPDGNTYRTDAPTLEEAIKSVKEHVQKEFNTKEAKDIEASPAWQRPFQAIEDVARVGVDTVAAGIPDYLAGGDQSMKTAAARDRMGWAGTALDVGTAARFIPSLVPKAIKWAAGGPLARTVVGSTTAGGEGAVYGGVNAATHDQDVPTGAALGGVGGQIGHAIGSGVNRIVKAFSPSDIPKTTGILSTSGLKAPTNVQKIEAAINQSNQGTSGPQAQKQVQDKLKSLVVNAKPKEFTPTQTSLMKKVYEGDPATNVSREVGEFLNNKLLAGGAGIGALATGSPLAAAAIGGGMLAGGKVLKGISQGGTEEAVQNLRRTMFKVPKFKGPVSEAEKARIANMVKVGLLSQQED